MKYNAIMPIVVNTGGVDDGMRRVAACFDRYPILRVAALVVQHTWRTPVSLKTLEDTRDLIEHVNRVYPSDTFDPIVLASLFQWKTHLSIEEYDILVGMLPWNGGPTSTKIEVIGNDLSVQFTYNPKNGGREEVRFTGKGGMNLPLKVEYVRWSDMDDMDNHDDACPDKLNSTDDDGPEIEGECYCEPTVLDADDRTFHVWNPNTTPSEVKTWLGEKLGY